MTIVRIEKDFKFEAAHQLQGHPGKCQWLHGHSYRVTVWIKGTLSEETGMLMDYDELKETCQPVIDEMDHTYLAEGSEDLIWGRDLPLLTLLGIRVYSVGMRTTAENIASYLARKWEDAFLTFEQLQLFGVVVHETATSSAEYIVDLRPLLGLRPIYHTS